MFLSIELMQIAPKKMKTVQNKANWKKKKKEQYREAAVGCKDRSMICRRSFTDDKKPGYRKTILFIFLIFLFIVKNYRNHYFYLYSFKCNPISMLENRKKKLTVSNFDEYCAIPDKNKNNM